MWPRRLLRVLQGALIGAGAILPGISGGVLAVIFGVYEPLMETLAHPRTGVKKNIGLLLPLLLGWALGFLGGGAAVLSLLDHSETVATWLFIGLLLGTFPSLWREAGETGRTKSGWACFLLSFAAVIGVLLYARYGRMYSMPQNFFGFLFCGILWGFSIIVPGMTSSSVLMSVGLLTPLLDGITAIRWSVILPWLLGMAAVLLLLSRVVSSINHRYGMQFRHAVCGFVLASTLAIVPRQYTGGHEIVMSVICAVLGLAAAVFSSRLQTRQEEKGEKNE